MTSCRVKILFFIVLSFFVSTRSYALDIDGSLLERGTRKPLEDVSVYLIHKYNKKILKTVTGVGGDFIVKDVPDGVYLWTINLTGYLKYEKRVVVNSRSSQEYVDLYLEKDSYLTFETTVYGKRIKRDDNTQSEKVEELMQQPGAAGDPIKGIKNLPGIARSNSFSSRVIIQGSGPQNTKYTIDGHEVPLVFHFGGLSSVFFPDSIDRVDYLSAGYGPEYGRATGGLIGVWTKKPKTDRLHGLVFVDLLNTGALIEGPLGKEGSFLLSARQSYVGKILEGVFKNNESFNFTLAPTFNDINFIYQNKPTENSEFKLVSVASSDTLKFLLSEPVKTDPSVRGEFETKTAFFRLIPQFTYKHSKESISRFSLGIGKEWLKFVNGKNYFYIGAVSMTVRGEHERKFSPKFKSFLGFDNDYGWARVNIVLPSRFSGGGVSNPISVGDYRSVNVDAKNHSTAIYLRNEYKLNNRFTLMPNLRADYFVTTKELYGSPRLAMRYKWDKSFFSRLGFGLYYQPPQPEKTDSVFGNPDVLSEKVWQLSMGFEKDFREGSNEGFSLRVNTFYKYLARLISQSTALTTRNGQTVPEYFNNDGRGRVYGIETRLKFQHHPWSASLAYTLSKSTRSSSTQPENPYQYDQTHNLGVLGAVQLGNWQISSRIRYSTGNPYTPITGSILDSDNDIYIPIRGEYFSQRYSPFFQWDIRFDKKWIYDTWILSLYLDIQNATNRSNIESLSYSYDYSESVPNSGLPIVPIFGIKGEF